MIFLFLILISYSICGSKYEIDITLPSCSDSTNPEIHFITQDSDWSEINNPSKTIFCVKNGDYDGAGVISITSSGTSEKKRYIILNNGNDIHPGKLSTNQMANVRFDFNSGSSHWIVDRMSCLDYSTQTLTCYIIRGRSSYIVLNRLFLDNFFNGVSVRGSSSPPYPTDNVVQNSRFEKMSAIGIDNDRVAIALTGENYNLDRTIWNTKMLNNELKNTNDAIQLVQHPQFVNFINYPGTIIDGNHMYINSDVFTDGSGNHKADGEYAWTENALDFKGGSHDILNPVIVTNNMMWGWRHTDQNGGGSSSWGDASSGHFHVRNIIMKHNVVFNCERGITFAAKDVFPYAVENGIVSYNIFYDVGIETAIAPGFAHLGYSSKNYTFTKNVVYTKEKSARWNYFNNDEIDYVVEDNVIMDSYQCGGPRSVQTSVKGNYFYDTIRSSESDGTVYDSVEDAKHTDFTFTTDRFTNNPRDITLYGVMPTIDSPHVKDHPDFLNIIPPDTNDDDDDDDLSTGEIILYVSLGIGGLILIIVFLIFLIAILVVFFACKKKKNGVHNSQKIIGQ